MYEYQPLSPLESLPVELLEEIYLYIVGEDLSRAFSFPRSSPYLGLVLASRHIKTSLVMRTMCWPYEYRTTNKASVRYRYVEDNRDVRQAVFDMAWFTYDLLIDSQRRTVFNILLSHYRTWAECKV